MQDHDRPVIVNAKPDLGENHLINLLRFLAALSVAFMHVRTVLFVDYDLAPHGFVSKLLYACTSLGKEAVTVFFVLSGFWVGGSVIRKSRRGRFGWSDYLIDRIVRLSLVVVPALLLTVVLDYVGMHYFGDASVYTGDARYQGVVGATAAPRGWLLILSNVLFLQGVFTAPYGSNTALWSVGIEFWMYLIGAVMIIAALVRSKGHLFVTALLTIAVGLASLQTLIYLGTWLLGAGVAAASPSIQRSGARTTQLQRIAIRLACAIILFGAAIAARGVPMPHVISLYIVAIAAALLLATLVLGHDGTSQNSSFKFASVLAASSFSLYAIHEPILLFGAAAAGIDLDHRWPADALHWLTLIAIIGCMMALAAVFAHITERNTGHVRDIVKSKLSRKTLRYGSSLPR